MSQSNGGYPPFSLNIHAPSQQSIFDPYVQQTINNIQQQWRPSRPRSVQPDMSSPSISVRSTRTAPVQIPVDRLAFYSSNGAQMRDRNNASVHGVDTLALPANGSRNAWDTLDRHDYQKDSWNPLNLRSSNASDDRTSLSESTGGFKDYRTRPGSMGSAALPSDSGFYSMSVISHDPSRLEHTGISPNPTQKISNLHVQSTASEASRSRRMHPDQRSQISRRSSRSGIDTEPLKCLECNKVSKCKSDFKYV
jgi:hypothetical protein